jgi:plasmid stability protein
MNVDSAKERGVYFIADVDSGKVYVGSTENKRRRLRDHERMLENNKHHNPPLQNAYNKGHAFETTFLPLESHVDIRKVEGVFLDHLKDEKVLLNVSMDPIAPMAGRKQTPEQIEAARQRMMGNTYTLGHKQTDEHKQNAVAGRAGYRHSEETIAKISESNKGKQTDKVISPENLEKLRQANLGHTRSYGRTHSDETKEKLRILSTGRTHSVSEEAREVMRQAKLGKPLSEEHRQKLSVAGMGRVDSPETRAKKSLANADRAKPVVIEGVEYGSRNAAAKALGVTLTTITNRINSGLYK